MSYFGKDKCMRLEDRLTEVSIGNNPELSDVFNTALQQVFSTHYFKKINNVVSKNINLKKVRKRNENIVAYNKGNSIFVNETVFNQYSFKDRVRYLMHEFIHLLERKRKLFFFKEFGEIGKVSDELYNIMKKNLTKPASVFLISRNVKLKGTEREVLTYLMNDKIDWSAITMQGKQEIVSALRRSGIFNLSHSFWRKRLS